jgi:glycyl-tRNA synthetase alpha subunit
MGWERWVDGMEFAKQRVFEMVVVNDKWMRSIETEVIEIGRWG